MKKVYKSFIRNMFAALCISVISVSTAIAQSWEVNNWVPIDCLDDTLYIQKYEPFTSHEIGKSVREALSHARNMEDSLAIKDLLLDGAAFFNLILYRKINNAIDDIITSREDIPFIAVHKTDLNENVNNNYRYVIRSTFTLESFESANQYRNGFHIYDIENDMQFLNYPTLTSLIEAIEYSKELQRKDSSLDQGTLDNKLVDKAMKPAQRRRTFAQVVFWISFAIIVVLANLL